MIQGLQGVWKSDLEKNEYHCLRYIWSIMFIVNTATLYIVPGRNAFKEVFPKKYYKSTIMAYIGKAEELTIHNNTLDNCLQG